MEGVMRDDAMLEGLTSNLFLLHPISSILRCFVDLQLHGLYGLRGPRGRLEICVAQSFTSVQTSVCYGNFEDFENTY